MSFLIGNNKHLAFYAKCSEPNPPDWLPSHKSCLLHVNWKNTDQWDYTVLFPVAAAGNINLLNRLLESGANAKAVSRGDCTALLRAKGAECTLRLLKAGAPIDTVDCHGCTVFHYATEDGDYEKLMTCIEWVKSHQIDPKICRLKDDNHDTALFNAYFNKHDNCYAALSSFLEAAVVDESVPPLPEEILEKIPLISHLITDERYYDMLCQSPTVLQSAFARLKFFRQDTQFGYNEVHHIARACEIFNMLYPKHKNTMDILKRIVHSHEGFVYQPVRLDDTAITNLLFIIPLTIKWAQYRMVPLNEKERAWRILIDWLKNPDSGISQFEGPNYEMDSFSDQLFQLRASSFHIDPSNRQVIVNSRINPVVFRNKVLACGQPSMMLLSQFIKFG